MEAMFKVGSYYKQYAGQLVRLELCPESGMARAMVMASGGKSFWNGNRRLIDGVDLSMQSFGNHGNGCDLLPGECDEKGNPISAEKPAEHGDEMTFADLLHNLLTPANAAMIARDGPAQVKPTPIPAAPKPTYTLHAPLAGLSQVTEQSHKFGSACLGKCA